MKPTIYDSVFTPENLLATLNDPIKGPTLAVRLCQLLNSGSWGYRHGSMRNFSHLLAAHATLTATDYVTGQHIHDTTMEGWCALQKILQRNPTDNRKVLRYTSATISTLNDSSTAERCEIYVFHGDVKLVADMLIPVGNRGIPTWNESIFFKCGDASGRYPIWAIRGFDIDSGVEVDIEVVFADLKIAQENSNKLLRDILERLDQEN